MGCVQSRESCVNMERHMEPGRHRESVESLPMCTDYTECYRLQRLREILQHYTEWTLQQKKETSIASIGIYEFIHEENNLKSTDSYSIIKLLNDYHHLLRHHAEAFEDIYNKWFGEKKCDMKNCVMLSRNHRNRSNVHNTSSIYFNHKDKKEMIAQQFLDQIHSYVNHTFDMGFKLNKQQQSELEEKTEQKLGKEPISSNNGCHSTYDWDSAEKQSEYRRRERIGRFMKQKKEQMREENLLNAEKVEHNKFISVLDEDMAIEKKYDNKHHFNDSMFSFGVRYYYNKNKYEDNNDLDVEYNQGYKYKDWYIAKKHANLKDELLNNKTHQLDKPQYSSLYMRAQEYLRTDFVVENCGGIRTRHLMALIIYCNFDGLQCEFTKTYRHLHDESDQELKQRHVEFANLGHILQEAVEFNGTQVQKGKTKTFYHGTNVELMLTSTLHRFCGPFSTSSEYEVALLFTTGNGIILELNDGTLLSDESESIYFDCEYISDFGYEKEKFFIGGKYPLKIVSILHVKSNQNYGPYIKLITILLSIIKGNISLNASDDDLTERNQQAIVRLLKHETAQQTLQYLPVYIGKLLHHICLNISFITTRYSATFGKKKYGILAQYLCSSECSMFNLNLLNILFPNLASIAIECSALTHTIFGDILLFLKSHAEDEKSSNLNNIVFQSPVSGSLSFNTIQKAYLPQFKQYQWSIHIKSKKKQLILKRDKKCDEDRKASTNVLNSEQIFKKAETFVLQQTLSALSNDDREDGM